MIQYDTYRNFLNEITTANDLRFFKSNPSYMEILEHVSQDHGEHYLKLILGNTNILLKDITEFCKLNDAQGNPKKFQYGELLTSATSLRYIWHAHLILTHFKSFNDSHYNIVEVGGGYGGLCLAIHFFSHKYYISIQSYTIIDLEEAGRLQKLYLTNLKVPFQFQILVSDTFGKEVQGTDNYLISNYCFSEINKEFQDEYRKFLFPKVKHGFLAWNMIPLYDIGFKVDIQEEVPKTGIFNKFVYF